MARATCSICRKEILNSSLDSKKDLVCARCTPLAKQRGIATTKRISSIPNERTELFGLNSAKNSSLENLSEDYRDAQLFHEVKVDFENGKINQFFWNQAFVLAEGDETLASYKYIKLLVQKLKSNPANRYYENSENRALKRADYELQASIDEKIRQSKIARDSLVKGSTSIRNHCWSCRASLSGSTHLKCSNCGWLRCRCGVCEYDCKLDRGKFSGYEPS